MQSDEKRLYQKAGPQERMRTVPRCMPFREPRAEIPGMTVHARAKVYYPGGDAPNRRRKKKMTIMHTADKAEVETEIQAGGYGSF